MKIKTNAKVFKKSLYYCATYAMIGAFLKMAVCDWSIFFLRLRNSKIKYG